MSCTRGCTIHNQHQPPCTCTAECPDHDTHCKGCIPATSTVGDLCNKCIGQTRSALHAIPELVAQVASRTDGKLSPVRKGTSDGMPKASHVHAPSMSPAWDTAEEVIQWAHQTALACADANHHQGPFAYTRAGLPARALTRTITYITGNLPWYAAVIPAEIHAEATTIRRNLERLTGNDRATQRLKSPCPSCDHRTLIRDETLQVTCRNTDCGRIWRDGEYDDQLAG